ncbi:MAG: entericidin A/B family lipoprotein [Parvibaculum sp.]|uniref:entericidin A/B family lipoprotein n=1 Tax=Parvibaculum sp. TaxID=2024848 RepID=UPI003C7278ED
MKKNFTRVALLVLVAGYGAAGLAACNTVEGAGKDVKATGSTIENSARNAK